VKRLLLTAVLVIVGWVGASTQTRDRPPEGRAITHCPSEAKPACSLEVYFLDVEGGASTLLVTPAGESVLIDAGYGQREGRDPARVMAAMRDAGVDHLDFFIATHLHNDHVGGLPELAEKVRIGTFVEIQRNAVIGRNCKVSSHTFICEGVVIDDEVFVGHNVNFINDRMPRATNRSNNTHSRV